MDERIAAKTTVTRGKNVPRNCNITAIIISTNSDSLARRAAESILKNTQPCELIVVNTGRGTLRPVIHDIMDQLVLIECSERNYAGGARNLGIRIASSPIISFLAADCIAPPDWLHLRLEAHSTSDLVPSSLLPAPLEDETLSKTCWAAYFSTHFERIPGAPPRLGKPFGLSYCRKIFDKHGFFDPALRTGEDSEFNARIPAYSHLSPLTKVVTLHSYPSRLREAISIQYKRGIHEQRFSKARYNRSKLITTGRTLKRSSLAFLWVLKNKPEHCKQIKKSVYIIAILVLTRAIGNLFPIGRE